jgi:hypothetical protein
VTAYEEINRIASKMVAHTIDSELNYKAMPLALN